MIWPTRHELITYTTVALTFVIVMAVIVSLLDLGFYHLVTAVLG